MKLGLDLYRHYAQRRVLLLRCAGRLHIHHRASRRLLPAKAPRIRQTISQPAAKTSPGASPAIPTSCGRPRSSSHFAKQIEAAGLKLGGHREPRPRALVRHSPRRSQASAAYPECPNHPARHGRGRHRALSAITSPSPESAVASSGPFARGGAESVGMDGPVDAPCPTAWSPEHDLRPQRRPGNARIHHPRRALASPATLP